ncbi:carbohydrate porin [Vibrio sp. CAU 1672]|uniref:carbohydrate porin n=1 Tax=Vibrio sp. CAU 1672 TaxID=3032594 RepID=UPI0023DA69C9|nr:carbohydrate porin [Vibrio sp. CAU 1672]MDF2155185.1 carbohydrate porin [Vibrio sp. CAU 1672]
MKNFKVVPLTLAVAASLASVSTFANADVDALLKRVEALESQQSSDVQFTGYARYGFHFEADGNRYVGAAGQKAGNAAGRLGNETNGGEFQFTKRFEGANGTKWDLNVMMENWWKMPGDVDGDIVGNADVFLKKFYAGVSNVFDAQPDLYIWAGRDFHQRPQEGLNDYFLMTHDGQGAGFKNLDMGALKLDVGFVGQTDGSNWTGTGDSGNYALTSKLHGLSLGEGNNLDIYMNYGLSDDKSDSADVDEAFQVATVFDFSGKKLSLRYSTNSDNTAFNRTEGLDTIYASFQSGISLGDKTSMDYQLAYHNSEYADNAAQDRTNYSVIVRPMHAWDDTHSTWLEAGYSLVDYDQANESNAAWKITVSQNMAIDSVPWGRPMLRFYATAGEADNKVNGDGVAVASDKVDTFAVGAMFEAWW